MGLSNNELSKYFNRIILSKSRILISHPFYALLLMHMRFAIDEKCETAYTDGEKIAFSPVFMDQLSDKELDFVMMHEILHVALHHCLRGRDLQDERYNIACDIVVNSNILYSNNMDRSTITLKEHGEAMHLTPNKEEGYLYTAEEVYKMLPNQKKIVSFDKGNGKGNTKSKNNFDSHDKWEKGDGDNNIERDEWLKRIKEATEVVEILNSQADAGKIPLCAKRLLESRYSSLLDWRVILNEFVQEEINDYSFSPPDRRFSETDFFLPDFNEKDEKVKNIWFVIDTSGSVSDKAIYNAYGEISSAIEQFNGRLEGSLSFCESYVTDPVPFSSISDLHKIKPVGGGGTNLAEIFKYMKDNMIDNLPSYIIILTDGYDTFPKEEVTMKIPVLWLINNNKITPPFGKVARMPEN